MKRIIALMLVVLSFTLVLVACGNDNKPDEKDTVTLTVWGSQEDQALLKELADKFKTENTDKTYEFKFGVVGEKDTQTVILEDPSKAADIFSIPDDQLRGLVDAGAMYEITGDYLKNITDNNISLAVEAAKVNNKTYAFPSTADNGYFLYYDKSVFSDNESVATLDQILNTCIENNKKFAMDISNGYYLMSFFVGNGCTLKIDEQGKQYIDFNNSNGLNAANAILEICKNSAFMTGDDTIVTSKFGTDIAACVSGIWNIDALIKQVGEDNLGAYKLPTFTVNDEQVQMSSFAGCKLVGVSKTTKYPAEALKFADYITNEKAQLLRFEERGYGPSNKKVAEMDILNNNLGISALAAQNEYAISQATSVVNSYWVPAEALGTTLESKDLGGKTMQELLDKMVKDIIGE